MEKRNRGPKRHSSLRRTVTIGLFGLALTGLLTTAIWGLTSTKTTTTSSPPVPSSEPQEPLSKKVLRLNANRMVDVMLADPGSTAPVFTQVFNQYARVTGCAYGGRAGVYADKKQLRKELAVARKELSVVPDGYAEPLLASAARQGVWFMVGQACPLVGAEATAG
jgi:hypothetical protein